MAQVKNTHDAVLTLQELHNLGLDVFISDNELMNSKYDIVVDTKRDRLSVPQVK